MRRLVVIACVEICVIVLLALQLAGARPGARPGQGAPAGDAARPEVAPATAAAGVAPGVGSPGAARAPREPAASEAGASGPGADLPVRHRVTAEPSHDPKDPLGILLSGTLRGTDGSSVEGASLYVSQDDHGVAANVAKDGSYAASGLRPGEWRFVVRASGFANLEEKHTLGDAAFQRLDLEVRPAYRVRVRIETPDGKDANALLSRQLGLHFGLHVVGGSEPLPEQLAPTDYGIVWFGDANWQRDERPKDGVAGVLELPAPPPAYVAALLRHVVLAQQRVEPGQKEVKLVVDPAAAAAQMSTVRMRLVDADSGAPIANTSCTLRSTSGGGAGGKSDAEGRVEVKNALPGLLILEIRSGKEYEQVTTTVRAEPGVTTDLGDLRLHKPVTFGGVVLGADGKPHAGASVQWTELRWRNGPRPFVDNRSTSADAEGKFTLWGVGPGKIAVTARGRDGRLAVGVFDCPAPTPAELRLADPALARVLRPRDPARSFLLTIYDAAQQPVAARRLDPRSTSTSLSLPAGDYTYDVHDDRDRKVGGGTLRLGPVPQTIEIR